MAHFLVITIDEQPEKALKKALKGSYDYYELGGSWNGYLRLKDGTRVNQGRKKDLDFSDFREPYYVVTGGQSVSGSHTITAILAASDEALLTVYDIHQ